MSPVQWNSPILFFQNLFFLIRNANRLRLSLPLSIFIAISQEKNVHIGSANDVPPFQCKRAPQQDKMILSCKRQRCRPIDFHLRIGVSCWTIYATPNSLTTKKLGTDTRWMSFAPCWSTTTRLSQFVNQHTSIREAVLTNFGGIFFVFQLATLTFLKTFISFLKNRNKKHWETRSKWMFNLH